MAILLHPDECYSIMGACFEVYNRMGSGFREQVYHECVEIELREQSIPFVQKDPITLNYRRQPLRSFLAPDFICFEKVIVEIKAIKAIDNECRAQILNYLRATQLKLGIVVNFGSTPKLEYARFVR